MTRLSLVNGLRRPDWLKELQVLLVIALALVTVFGAGAVIAGAVAGDGVRIDLPATAVTGTPDHGLRPGATVVAGQDLAVTVADPTATQRLSWALTTLPTQLLLIAVLGLLLRTVWRARRDDPFLPGTVRRLRVLATTALAGGGAVFAVELLAATWLSGSIVEGGFAGSATLPVHWVLVGVGLYAVAALVDRGSAMRAELATLV
ncbi:Protein of unknown function (DUF2975) [Stackebrandtia albiflava]|uniref:DUF2975 family protein n=1 Tax=Stackebrandtia albiflava TaxID=406432 RepID=A0A562V2L4_9ACTN|nr:DUF2975 domain-containing protein [Stackebrandtia albiflava]TWJ12095.1 Protein of unknown function (DUF2975) [Stackebrandtia albiflava]